MASYSFEIAGLSLLLEIPWPLKMTDNFFPFLQKEGTPWQERIVMSGVEALPSVPQPSQWNRGVGKTILDGKACILRRLTDTAAPYVLEVERAPGDWIYLIRRGSNEIPTTMQQVFHNISLESLILRHHILLLHSSLIRWQEKAILFSAPSGTGKSTQADLWAKYEQADILNGDRSALRKVDGVWTAFGLPFAGSSEIFRNESAPIGTIVLLEKGPENSIRRLSPREALTKFYAEVTIHYWEKDYVNHALDLILELLQQVPVFLLSCRPDQGAVQLLRDTINEVKT